MLLAALLCLSMLFAACDSSDADDIEGTSETESETVNETEGEDTSETEAPVALETEERPVDEVVNYEDIIDIWGTYFSYDKEEGDKAYTSVTQLFTTAEIDIDRDGDDDTTTTVQSNGHMFLVVRRNNITGTRTYMVYNAESGKRILSVSETYSETYKIKTREYSCTDNGGYIRLTESIRSRVEPEEGEENAQDQFETVTYQYCYDYDGNVLAKVETGNGESFSYTDYYNMFKELVITKPENVGTELEPEWENVSRYTYYDQDGKLYAKDVEEAATYYSDLDCVRLEGKNYYFEDGEIIFVDENIVPVTIANDFGSRDLQFENYDYYVNGNNVKVVNTDTYKIVAEYTSPYQVSGMYVLANGNVYIYTHVANSNVYTLEDYNGVKYLHHDVVLNVATGVATEVEASFVIDEMATTAVSNLSDTAIKDGCNFAIIRPVVDGEIARECEFVILDSNLARIATLPKIVENQTSFVGMVDEDRFIVTATNFVGTLGRFIADAETNTLTPYLDTVTLNTVKIENGFLVTEDDYIGGYRRYTVYNSMLEKVAEFTSEQSPIVSNGVIKFHDRVVYERSEDPDPDDAFVNDDQYEIETEIVYKVGFVDANGEFVVNEVSRDREASKLGSLKIWTVYNEEHITGNSAVTRYVYNVYGEQIKVLYDVQAISVYYQGEDFALVRTTTPDGYIYYIIK